MDNITWLQRWYSSNCDGDWEHLYGVKINNVDNPGWKIEIDTSASNTVLEDSDYGLTEQSEDDWFAYKVEKHIYVAVGSPDKLDLLIGLFRSLVGKSFE